LAQKSYAKDRFTHWDREIGEQTVVFSVEIYNFEATNFWLLL
jgi:hypothetical protein